MGVLQTLEHVQLVVDHSLVALHILLENDLDGTLASRTVSLTDDTVSSSSEGATEAIFSPVERTSGYGI